MTGAKGKKIPHEQARLIKKLVKRIDVVSDELDKCKWYRFKERIDLSKRKWNLEKAMLSIYTKY